MRFWDARSLSVFLECKNKSRYFKTMQLTFVECRHNRKKVTKSIDRCSASFVAGDFRNMH
jgi:hypothetical protein